MSNSYDGPESATTEIGHMMESDQALTEALKALQRCKSPGTVVFFDLVGSTGYRHRYHAEAGLQKAHLHNMTVSRCITESGGKVVKWIGDAVMGFFCGLSEPRHAFRAVNAALNAIEKLKQVNKSEVLRRITRSVPGGAEKDHDIHTKVGLSSGLVHHFDLLAWLEPKKTASGTKLGQFQDPMGSCVDLASRLTHLAQPDVILLDGATFWGQQVAAEEGSVPVKIEGVTSAATDIVRWRRLLFDQVRDTVYIPRVTAFFVMNNSLDLSRFVQASDGGMSAKQIYSLIEDERQSDKLKITPVVFAHQTVHCNVSGFDECVPVISLASTPTVAPIKHSQHAWPAEEVVSKVRDAERSFRSGEHFAAESKFRQVLEHDHRNYHAHLRLGMLARAAGEPELALKHLTSAKESNPDNPLAWAVAGMVHLDNFIHDNGNEDSRESLDRAVTGFTRAKKLAFDCFHGLLEQYCTCLLAITHLLNRRDQKMLLHGRTLLDELSRWAPKNLISLRLMELATIFLKIAENDTAAKESIEKLQADLESDKGRPKDAFKSVPYDHVLHFEDVSDLASEAVHRHNVQRERVIARSK